MKAKLWLSLGLAGLLLALTVGLLALAGLPAARAAGGETFTVNDSGDTPDASPDCLCQTSGGKCTLRAAIQEANACPGSQTIRFSMPMNITPTTALPLIKDWQTVIDASDRWLDTPDHRPGVVLVGNSGAFSGLVITASHCAVYGLWIRGFGQDGVHLYGGASKNAIGGTGTRQGNVISGNGWNGVRIEGATTTDNVVASNSIGINGGHGVSVWEARDNVITGNWVAGNGWSGVAVDYVTSGEIWNNRIGLNGFYGIHLANGSRPAVVSNTIAFNRRGIHIEGGAQPVISENTIYSNTASTLATPRGGGILIIGRGSHPEISDNDILNNTASSGGGIAVESGANPLIRRNTIQANRVQVAGDEMGGGGGIYVYQAWATINDNQILSNTVAGHWTTSFPLGGGIYLQSVKSVTVTDNEIRGNRVSGMEGRGGGISIGHEGDVQIVHNTVVDNYAYGGRHGGGIYIGSDPWATQHVTLDRNRVVSNHSSGAAVSLMGCGYVTLTNNVIVSNDNEGLYVANCDADTSVINNTIALNRGDGVSLYSSRLALYNTIIAFNHGYGVYCDGVWFLIQNHNDVWGNAWGSSNSGLSFFMERNPLFFNASAGQFALRAGSPCIDVGNARVATSYNGLPRPQGAGHDLGAYEMALPAFLPLVLRNY